MSDLTDSYCERCGTRYVFSPPTPKTLSLKGARVLAKGLKNFVLTDGQSMADSLTLARHDDNHEDSSRITEAFHRTFNFCMTCRQYACDRCWNSRVGACLSCSPESGYEPVAPEDHLIVRTPVARWDTDWSLFPEGPAVEPVVRPAPPTPFDASIQFSESQPAVAPEGPTPAAWPVADLPGDVVAGPAVQGARSGHRSIHKPVDQQAASLWPITDEIAPEMTLTPEELELVEFKLARGETTADLTPHHDPAPEPLILASPPESQPPQQAPAEELVSSAEWPSSGATWTASAAPMPEPSTADPGIIPAAPQPMAQETAAPGLDVQASSQHLLKMPVALPLAPLPQAVPPSDLQPPAREPGHEHAPIVGRLLGRHKQQTETSTPGKPSPVSKRRGQPAGDPWPHVTTWSDRPILAHDWSADADAAIEEVEAQAAVASATPAVFMLEPAALAEPVVTSEGQRRWPVPPQSEPQPIDARSAAAVRLPAVTAGVAETGAAAELDPAPPEASIWIPAETAQAIQSATTANQQPQAPAEPPTQPLLFDLRPAGPVGLRPTVSEPPAWPNADRDVVDAVRSRSSKMPDQTREPRSGDPAEVSAGPTGILSPHAAPSAPWQPLGSSWPVTQNPKAPWAGPGTPSVLSVVAAQQAAAPTVTEMWAQSSQEVLNRGTVRVCHRCALPVSTQARFCRRCGTQQG
jgi:ribosomal protein L40E